jgi:hypothetical protein
MGGMRANVHPGDRDQHEVLVGFAAICLALRDRAPSWDFPRDEALRDLVERERLYPITVLSSLGDHDKEELIARGIVTCRSLARSREVLTDMRVSARKQEAILREADTLLSSD